MVLRRAFLLTVLWMAGFALLWTGTAHAQEEGADDDDAPAEIVYYGDSELIDTLTTYGLLDEWMAASPVSPQASLLLVNGGGSYQAQREAFLDSIDAWVTRTERVRAKLARIDAAQASADGLRSATTQVRDALVLDDRLASESKTLVEIEDVLSQLPALELPEYEAGETEDPVFLAESQLNTLRTLAQAEIKALNGAEPAVSSSGIGAFVGFDELQAGLDNVEQHIKRARDLIRPAREQSEQLVSSALAQIPSLHSARMLGASDVNGLSVVTVDAYVRAAALAPCSVDWALLAGIGQIESNHGRIGGASVSRAGNVSTSILGPLLDGGETEREAEIARQSSEDPFAGFDRSVRALLRRFAGGTVEPGDQGNGFAVIVDSDGGRLDGNDQWDRAVGPMQFLPETWSKWATDGNGDGVVDPHNLYDAAASAGRFLCNLSATRGPSPSTFVLGYNASTSYVRNVLSVASGLRSASLPVG